ncbi:UNVERIFIED_ORG: hypothetical protein L601_000500001750 [Gordonia westfalica J30]
MEIRVDAQTVRVVARENLRSLSVSTRVSAADTSEMLRGRGIGYVDGCVAYVNTWWLQSLRDNRRWLDELREMSSFAECHGWFDGVYLRARLESDPESRISRSALAPAPR